MTNPLSRDSKESHRRGIGIVVTSIALIAAASERSRACSASGRRKKMRVVMRIVVTVAAVGTAACDPGYGVGARLRLAPTTSDSCILAAVSGYLKSPDEKRVDLKRGSSYQVSMIVPSAVADSAPWFWNHALLVIGPISDSTLPVEIVKSWIGNAQTVPLSYQRRFIAVATSRLAEVRVHCAQATAKIECLAIGQGGHPACEQ
jgi:hypothetical protein